MAKTIVPPIFNVEMGDAGSLMAFMSEEHAQTFLEPDYLEHDSEIFYDSEGRLLSWTSDAQQGLSFDTVDEVPQHQAELMISLIGYLQLCGHHAEMLRALSLHELVQLASEKAVGRR